MAELPVPAEGVAPARVEDHPVALYLARLTSPTSRRTMLSKLNQAARLLSGDSQSDAWGLPWHSLSPIHLDALRSMLAESYSPSTANTTLAAVRGVLRSCWRAGRISGEAFQRLVDIEPVRGNTVAAGRGLEPGELIALFEICAVDRKPNRGARDSAILALLYGAGLRRAEAAGLDLADVDLESEHLTIRKGKGNKARQVPLVLNAADAIAAWIDRRGDWPGPLLVPVNKGDNTHPRRMRPESIGRVLDRLVAEAGLKACTAHDLRRSWISDLLDAGGDVVTVQQLAGHASPTTTSRYDRRPAEARKRAARMLRVPYRSRS